METKIIKPLPTNEFRVIKQIIIISDSLTKSNLIIGYILYERLLSDKYKFKEQKKDPNKLNYLQEHDSQERYPHDELDKIILEAIKDKYPKSIVRNHSVLFNVQKENLQFLKNREIEKGYIEIYPEIMNVNLSNIHIEHKCYIQEIKIYINTKIDEIKSITFIGNYNLNDDNLIKELSKIKFI